MKGRYWSIIAILVLLNYLVFSQLIVLLVESTKPAPTPTRTPKPTFTHTFTPGPTPPTPTPPPPPTPTATRVVPLTDTPTPQGGPTSPPPPEATAGEVVPTATPRPPTATPQPAPPTAVPPTATEISPTDTPAPTEPPSGSQYQYRLGRPVTCLPNCGTTGVKGTVYDVHANRVPGVLVKIWADGWCCGHYETNTYAPYEILLGPGPRAGHWYVAVFSQDGSTQLSDVVDVYTDSEPCEPSSSGCQWAVVDFVAKW